MELVDITGATADHCETGKVVLPAIRTTLVAPVVQAESAVQCDDDSSLDAVGADLLRHTVLAAFLVRSPQSMARLRSFHYFYIHNRVARILLPLSLLVGAVCGILAFSRAGPPWLAWFGIFYFPGPVARALFWDRRVLMRLLTEFDVWFTFANLLTLVAGQAYLSSFHSDLDGATSAIAIGFMSVAFPSVLLADAACLLVPQSRAVLLTIASFCCLVVVDLLYLLGRINRDVPPEARQVIFPFGYRLDVQDFCLQRAITITVFVGKYAVNIVRYPGTCAIIRQRIKCSNAHRAYSTTNTNTASVGEHG
jgi:hypothetical protein